MRCRSDAKRRRHKWGREPVRLDYETVRTCVVCDLRKVTDHTAFPPMIYYVDPNGERFATMPECDAVQ